MTVSRFSIRCLLVSPLYCCCPGLGSRCKQMTNDCIIESDFTYQRCLVHGGSPQTRIVFCGSDFDRRFIVFGNGLIDLYYTLFLFYCGFILSELQFAHSSKKNIHECVTDLGFFMCLGNYYWATKQRKLWVCFGYRSDIRNLMHRHVNAFVNNSNKNFFMLQ